MSAPAPIQIALGLSELGQLPGSQAAGAWQVHTQFSTYEVRRDTVGGWQVRRTHGRNAPTARQGEDGVWMDAEDVHLYKDGMLIVWQGIESTWTSKVLGIVTLTHVAL